MGYSLFIDEREREQAFENRLNALHRHCLIGRVKDKMTIHGGKRVPVGEWRRHPLHTNGQRVQWASERNISIKG